MSRWSQMTEEQKERQRAYVRRWHKANADYERERKRKWRKNNRDRIREYSRRWQKANADHERERKRKWREANPDYRREYGARTQYHITYYKRNRAESLLKNAIWRANNVEKVAEYNARKKAKREAIRRQKMQYEQLAYAYELIINPHRKKSEKEAAKAVAALRALSAATRDAERRWLALVPISTVTVRKHTRAKQAIRKQAAEAALSVYRTTIKLAGRNVDDIYFSELPAIAKAGIYEGYLATALMRHAKPATDVKVRDLVTAAQLAKYHSDALAAVERIGREPEIFAA